MIYIWNVAYQNMKKAIDLQARYYNARHRMINFAVGDLVLLNTVNLRLRGVSGKLRKKFIGPFRVSEKIGTQSYRIELPQDCKLHNVFHVSLLRRRNESAYV